MITGATLSFQVSELADPPRVLPYPAAVPGLQIGLRRLNDGVWWLPSYRAGDSFGSGDLISLGPLLRAYKLDDPDGGLPRFVVWSPHGALARARFPFTKDSHALITDAAGVPLPVEKKTDSWIVPLGPDPIIVSHVATVPLPSDAADAAELEAARLIKLAKDQGISVDLYLERLFQIRNTIPTTSRDADLRYNAFARLVGDLTQTLQPFVWIEGESASSYTFDSLVSDSEASGGSYLSIDTDRQPSASHRGFGRRIPGRIQVLRQCHRRLCSLGCPAVQPATHRLLPIHLTPAVPIRCRMSPSLEKCTPESSFGASLVM